MKSLAIVLNVTGILLCFYLYQSFVAMVFAVIGLIPALTLVILSGLTHKGLTLVMMILNLCLSCGGGILMAVLLFNGVQTASPYSTEFTFTLISGFIVIAIVNMVLLKKIAQLKTQTH